uniref:Uncharacterized protein n=1 Tax=Schizaphis graminum TaxID=13262 RepID=A0A2S2P1W5_SCHGA
MNEYQIHEGHCTLYTYYLILGKYNILYTYNSLLNDVTFFQMVFWCLTVLSICRIDLFHQRRGCRNFYTHLKIPYRGKLCSLFSRHRSCVSFYYYYYYYLLGIFYDFRN